ncbi:NAD-dependent epimerase/dehydratase family protein [Rhizobium grahamii]|uniref:NAD-dependent epimerase/dehydratase n=2 Tax=Rhizobium grahamii TaxID=1120045 RepID=S3H7N6_9HYPH|nr:NAD-dependent epimerase/dehydratase family protein [Rhizobium grahamii]EPE94922.1 NAD-dependent epimerase/dehydratase [Rhizobium grahamii CCGE 502]RDJ05701.1 nucleoside-diphosphate sugar epimerase [Rhizobium grahamii]
MLLVTGATGFVGQDLQQELCTRGLAFRATSRTSRQGYSPVGDIDGATDWSAALSGIEIVIHLAATNQNVVTGSGEDRELLRTVNIEGTINLAGQAAASGVRRFIFLSTIKVNGERSVKGHPFTPDDVPAPQTDYAASKLEAEKRLIELSRSSGMEVVIIRPPLVYGRGVGGSFRALAKLVKSGIPLPLASISNRRSMVYVENLSDLVLTAALHPAAAGQVLLAGDVDAVSTPELVRHLAAAIGCPARLLPCPPLALRTLAAVAGKKELVSRLTEWLEVDITPTRSLLDWTPPFDMGQALKRCF